MAGVPLPALSERAAVHLRGPEHGDRLRVIGAIVGEFVGANRGIGFLILQANYQLDIAGAFSLFAVLSIMGVTLHACLRWLQRRCVFWMASDDPVGGGH